MNRVLSLDAYEQALRIDGPDGPKAPQHTLPSAQFLEELKEPTFVEAGGLTHAVYTFNADRLEDPSRLPVVVNLSYGYGAASRYGALVMNAFASQMDRPVVGIDLPGVGRSSKVSTLADVLPLSLSAVARARAEVVQKLEFEKVDVLGISLGGALAAKMAFRLGAAARQLMTFAAPGFRGDIVRSHYSGPSASRDEALHNAYDRQAVSIDGRKAAPYRHLIHRDVTPLRDVVEARMGVGTVWAGLHRMDKLLHRTTKWYDLVGTADGSTVWQEHLAAVERRNKCVPNSSQSTVINGGGHELSRTRIVLTARDAEMILRLA